MFPGGPGLLPWVLAPAILAGCRHLPACAPPLSRRGVPSNRRWFGASDHGFCAGLARPIATGMQQLTMPLYIFRNRDTCSKVVNHA